jgi:hypothetical protein
MNIDRLDPAILQGREEELAGASVVDVKFYYRKTSFTPNAFTACLLLDNANRIVSRGIAICSLSDIFEKKRGKMIAFGRAFAAAINEKSSREIYFDLFDRYWDEYILYSKTFKTQAELEEFKRLFMKECINIPGLFSGHILENEFTLKYEIPYSWNVYFTSYFFKYKSEYKPTPEEYESTILKCYSLP